VSDGGDIRLVVFDLGRVLVRTCDGWDHACELAKLPIKLPPRDQALRARLAGATMDMETGRIDTAEFCRRTGEVFGVDPAHIRAILDVYLIEPYPGVTELLDELEQRGVATACLSNTQTEHWNQMGHPSHRAALPMQRLTHHFASHLVGLRKPDDALYLHVERATGFSGPQIAFFDDLQENIAAAHRRGWRGIQITDADPIAQIRAELARLDVL
jgi:putative hydrolase of the HAD superfamily